MAEQHGTQRKPGHGSVDVEPSASAGRIDVGHAPHEQVPRGDLDRIYETRFSHDDAAAKDTVWVEVCSYLQRFVDSDAPVLDVAADRGHFVRNIRASERWATDIRDVREHLTDGIRFVQVSGTTMSALLPGNYFGTVFMSNYLEHLSDSDAVIEQLRQAYTVCRPGGRIVILQPNIRLVGGAYWDFLDHKTALTEKSLREAAELVGFRTRHLVTRFLPFTTKTRLPQTAGLVRLYLRFPPAWLLLGKQSLYVGERI